jgi:RNA polymerase sigma-70 factor (ECF subfamily)
VTTTRRRETPALAEAFERLVRRHRSEIFRTVFRLSRNREDAEDLTQITFLNAYAALQRGAEPEAPRAWLHAIARNAGSRRFRQTRIVEVELDDETSGPFDENLTTVAELQAALAQLTLNQRAALLMREVGGLSAREIATRLGITPGAVATLLFRARRALRAELEGTPEGRPLLGGLGMFATALRSAWLRLLGPALDGSEVLSRSAAAVGVGAAAAGIALFTTSAVPRPAHADRPRAAHALAVVHVAQVRRAPIVQISLPVEVRGATRVALVAVTPRQHHASAPTQTPTPTPTPTVRVSSSHAAPSQPSSVEQSVPEHVPAATPDAAVPEPRAETPQSAQVPADDPAPASQPGAQAQALVTSTSQALPSTQAVTSAVPTSAVPSAPSTALPESPVPVPVEAPAVTPPPVTPPPLTPPPVEPPALPPPPGILPSG